MIDSDINIRLYMNIYCINRTNVNERGGERRGGEGREGERNRLKENPKSKEE